MTQIQNFNLILDSLKIKASCNNYQEIGNYFFYDLQLKPSGKIKDIQKNLDEISIAIRSPGKPNCKILHQEGIIRLEYYKSTKETLNLSSLLNCGKPNYLIPCLLGTGTDGNLVWMDLADNPHLLVAGTTGSGKSTLLHNIIANILHFNSAELFLVDPKNIEFSPYQKYTRVYHSYDEALEVIEQLTESMNDIYEFMRMGYKSSSFKPKVLIIDEFANIIMQDSKDEFYIKLCNLAQKCRAANIHIILATQRPSVQFINGNIKANFPARISCRVSSSIDSRIILDESGAENLAGKGDALLKDNIRNLERFQIAFASANHTISNIKVNYSED